MHKDQHGLKREHLETCLLSWGSWKEFRTPWKWILTTAVNFLPPLHFKLTFLSSLLSLKVFRAYKIRFSNCHALFSCVCLLALANDKIYSSTDRSVVSHFVIMQLALIFFLDGICKDLSRLSYLSIIKYFYRKWICVYPSIVWILRELGRTHGILCQAK